MLKLPSVAFELTSRCNQQCVYCYNSWRDNPSAGPVELKTDDICRLIDRILEEVELRHITLTGGEPFMRDDIFEIIEHINSRNVGIAIISNGGRIDVERAARLAKCKVYYVQVTLGGPDAKRHDALCGPGSFRGTTDAARRLADKGVAVGGSFLCTRHNFDATEETYERMLEIGIRHHFALNRFNPSGCGSAFMTRLMPTRGEVLTALEQADRFADAHETRINCTMPIPRCMVDESEYPRVKFGQCAAGSTWGEPAVDPQGNLKLCTLQRQAIGSLHEKSLSTLFQSDQTRQFRSAVPDFCRTCPHRETCLGGCGAAADWIYGSADRLDPFLAQHVPEDVARSSIDVRIDPWFDLVYHTLAHLKIQTGDASTLYDPGYIAECDTWFEEHAPQLDNAVRPVSENAATLSYYYDQSQQPTLLHAFPQLYADIDDFRCSQPPTLNSNNWPTDANRRLADAILTRTHVALPELFHRTIQGELDYGFERFHAERLVCRAAAYQEYFTEHIQAIAEKLSGLAAMTWILSAPMGVHGRLLHWSTGGPIIVVGVGEGTMQSFPVIQGCHEYFVWQARQLVAMSGDAWSTVSGQPGYSEFQTVETTALKLGARFFLGSRWEEEYLKWLGRIYPHSSVRETAEKLASD